MKQKKIKGKQKSSQKIHTEMIKNNGINNTRKVLECSQAIAEAVRLCRPGVIAAYPITPQTHIVEQLAEFESHGKLNSKYINVESEHSAMSACIGAQAAGVRTFTASNSQGLALMSEMLFIASGLRLPIVMAISNRALSAPINIWNDQSDTIAQRDSSWIQLYCESSQEAFDTTIQAYKIAEKCSLPIMVCVDGFTLSHVWEPVFTLKQEDVDSFLPSYNPANKLDIDNPKTFGPIGGPASYIYFKKQQQEAMLDSIYLIKQVNSEFSKKFSRIYGDGLIETYKFENAESAIVAMGSVCGTIRTVIDELRKKGKKIGMLKVKCFRPFPNNEILKTCKNLKNIAVIDKDISFGNAGALFTEIKAALKDTNVKMNNFIAGLGGKDITQEDILKIYSKLGQKEEIEWIL